MHIIKGDKDFIKNALIRLIKAIIRKVRYRLIQRRRNRWVI